MAHRTRLDQVLVDHGFMTTRSRARDAIRRGHVRVAGKTETKPARLVLSDAAISVDDPASGYVARSALKLTAGLDAFGFSPKGKIALDIGASTGGFTQVLLERGAVKIHAVDVGHDQLDATLRSDPCVMVHEGTNARDLDHTLTDDPISAIAVDVSFISLKLILPPVLAIAAPGAFAVILVKPQFEVGRGALGKDGVVKDPARAEEVAQGIVRFVGELPGWRVAGLILSPIAGGDGNREFLMGAFRD